MSLTGGALTWLLVLCTAAVPVGAVLLWSRVRGPRAARAAQRLSLVVLAQAVAVLLAFTSVNDHFVFYASWNDLLGHPTAPPSILTVSGGTGHGYAGRLLKINYPGPVSHVTAEVLVHLPPEYDEPAYATHRFPVVVFLSGWRGYPNSWVTRLKLLQDLTTLGRQGKVQPFIAVMPTVNVADPRDAECTDIPRSTQAYTWLDTDVRNLVADRYRTLTQARSWEAVGYSTGGYCAVKLAYLDPQHWHAAVSLSGYYEALKDGTTGDLWGGSTRYRNANDLLWLTRHGHHPAVDVLVFTTKQDPDSYPSSVAFLHAATLPTRTYSSIALTGGHNTKVIELALPETLVWASQHLAGS